MRKTDKEIINMKGLTMKRQSRKNRRRVLASILTGMFLAQQSMGLSVLATSTITGVTNGGSGTFNINPTKTTNGIGFRQYDQFNLGKGDVANLNFTDINTFVNMVDNKVIINGIVNSIKDGKIGGNTIFIAPNGMLVGETGVINVGSLGVYTPTSTSYASLKNAQTENALNYAMNPGGGKEITINGKVITSGNIILKGGQINVGAQGGMVAGVNADKMQQFSEGDTGHNAANALFNQLVNTDNLTEASQFASTNGYIEITSQQFDDPAGVNIAGKVVNYNTETAQVQTYYDNLGLVTRDQENIKIISDGNNGINVSGTVANNKGIVKIQNNSGNLTISGKVKNNGTTQIFNTPADVNETRTNGDETSTYTSNHNTKLTISGEVDTKGDLTINNTGSLGTLISGTINHDGELNILNGIEGNTQSAIERNAEMSALEITGQINNTGNQTNIINYADGGLLVSDGTQSTPNINTNGLYMLNTGADGMTLDGYSVNSGNAVIKNENGELNVEGKFVNDGNATFTNDEDSYDFNVNGTITNKTGTLAMLNENGSLNVLGTVNNTGTTTSVTNHGVNGLNVSGTVASNGDLTMTNTGAKGLNIASSGRVNGNSHITTNNNGASGTNIKGLINAKKNVNINNQNSNVTIGDNTTNENYVTAGNNITITVDEGSILNYGV